MPSSFEQLGLHNSPWAGTLLVFPALSASWRDLALVDLPWPWCISKANVAQYLSIVYERLCVPLSRVSGGSTRLLCGRHLAARADAIARPRAAGSEKLVRPSTGSLAGLTRYMTCAVFFFAAAASSDVLDHHRREREQNAR